MDLNPIEEREDEIEVEISGSELEFPLEEVGVWGFFRWVYLLGTQTISTLKVSLHRPGQSPLWVLLSCNIVGSGFVMSKIINSGMAEFLNIAIFLLFGGFLSGILEYWVGGTVYHVLVTLFGGKGQWRDSKAIFIYSSLPGNLLYLIVGLFYLLVSNSFAPGIVPVASIGLLIVSVLTTVFQLKIRFTGAIYLHQANVTASLIFFVILPALLQIYTLVWMSTGLIF